MESYGNDITICGVGPVIDISTEGSYYVVSNVYLKGKLKKNV